MPVQTTPPFRLDLAAERLWHGEREVRLRPKTFAVLRYLAERPGRLVSGAELLRAVWSDVAVTEVMPRLCVRELRAALGDHARAPRFIETRAARGYRFVAPIVPLTGGVNDGGPEGAASRKARPLVGRQAELERLGGAFARASRRGERQIVFIGGEPGMGKTSLVEAFPRDRRRRQAPACAGRLRRAVRRRRALPSHPDRARAARPKRRRRRAARGAPPPGARLARTAAVADQTARARGAGGSARRRDVAGDAARARISARDARHGARARDLARGSPLGRSLHARSHRVPGITCIDEPAAIRSSW